jgi:ABC-type sugar transport system substrate-binding protein
LFKGWLFLNKLKKYLKYNLEVSKMNKKLVVFLLILGVVVGFSGCNRNKPAAEGGADSQAAGGKQFTIAIVLLEATGGNLNVRVAIEKLARERGYKTMYTVYENDNEKCMAAVQSYIQQKVDVIFVYTVDVAMQATVQKMCDEAGIHAAFTGSMESQYVTVADNEYDQGIFGAEKLIEAAEKKWGKDTEIDFVILTEATEVGAGNRIRMHEALQPALAKRWPNLKSNDFLWVDCGLDMLQATTDITNALASHPNAKKILIPTFFNTSGAQGAMNALLSSNRLDQALIMSYHISDKATLNYMINYPDVWIGTVYFPGESYAIPLFESAFDKWYRGETVEPGLLFCSYFWVTKDTIDDWRPYAFE